MSNYFLLLFFLSTSIFCMHDERLNLYRFDSAIDDEINTGDILHYETAKETLLIIAQEDQDLRRQALRAGRLYNKQHADALSKRHVLILKNIIATFGWPSEKTFNEDCSFAAWLIAQHADRNLKFQKKARSHIVQLNERFAPLYYTFLTDRISVNENKMQWYGTQYCADGTLWPIQNPEQLEQRRKRMALSPMQNYQDFMAIKFNQLKLGAPALPC